MQFHDKGTVFDLLLSIIYKNSVIFIAQKAQNISLVDNVVQHGRAFYCVFWNNFYSHESCSFFVDCSKDFRKCSTTDNLVEFVFLQYGFVFSKRFTNSLLLFIATFLNLCLILSLFNGTVQFCYHVQRFLLVELRALQIFHHPIWFVLDTLRFAFLGLLLEYDFTARHMQFLRLLRYGFQTFTWLFLLHICRFNFAFQSFEVAPHLGDLVVQRTQV